MLLNPGQTTTFILTLLESSPNELESNAVSIHASRHAQQLTILWEETWSVEKAVFLQPYLYALFVVKLLPII